MEVISKLNHEKDVEEIQQFSDIIDAETNLEKAKVEAEQYKNTIMPEAYTKKNLAESSSKAIAAKIMSQAKSYETNKMARADNEAAIIIERAETRLECAKAKTEALLKECAALTETQEDLVDKQLHEQRMAYLQKIKPLAQAGKVVITENPSTSKNVEIFKILGDDHSAKFERKFKDGEDDEEEDD